MVSAQEIVDFRGKQRRISRETTQLCAVYLIFVCFFCFIFGLFCSIRKTLFKWTPDHLAAAPHFEKSAAAYEAAQEFEKARLMYAQAADSQVEVSAFAAAANDLKKAAKLAVDLSEYDEASRTYCDSDMM